MALRLPEGISRPRGSASLERPASSVHKVDCGPAKIA